MKALQQHVVNRQSLSLDMPSSSSKWSSNCAVYSGSLSRIGSMRRVCHQDHTNKHSNGKGSLTGYCNVESCLISLSGWLACCLLTAFTCMKGTINAI